MTPPFPPLPVGAPENVQGWYSLACQKREREQIAQNMLDTLAPDADPALRKRYQEDVAFALLETENAQRLYIDALEEAGYPIETYPARKTA